MAAVNPGEEISATIYVENLPNEANESMLNLLFQQFPGFKKRILILYECTVFETHILTCFYTVQAEFIIMQ